jgi:hypothetical protein
MLIQWKQQCSAKWGQCGGSGVRFPALSPSMLMGHMTNLVPTVDRPDMLPIWLVVQLPEQLVLPVPVSGCSLWCVVGRRGVGVGFGSSDVVVVRVGMRENRRVRDVVVVRVGMRENRRVRGSGVQGFSSQASLHVYTSLATIWLPYKSIREDLSLQSTIRCDVP